MRLIQSVWSRSDSRPAAARRRGGKLARKRAEREREREKEQEAYRRWRRGEKSRRSGQAQAPVRSMPVSRSYKALVLGGRATVGVPRSEHAPRRESIVSRNKRFVSPLEDKRSAETTPPILLTLRFDSVSRGGRKARVFRFSHFREIGFDSSSVFWPSVVAVSKREWVKQVLDRGDDPSAFPGCPGASVDRLTSRIRTGWKVESRSTRRPARVDRWLPSRDVSPTFVPGEIRDPGRRQSGGRWTVRRTSRPPYGEAGGGEGGAVEEEEEGPRTCNKLRGSSSRRYYRRHRCRRHRPRHDVTWIS